MGISQKAVAKETLTALQGMQAVLGPVASAVDALHKKLADMSDPIVDGQKALKQWGDSLQHIVDTTAEGVDNYKEILSLTTRLRRMDVTAKGSQDKTLGYLKELQESYEKAAGFHSHEVEESKKILKVQTAITAAIKAATGSAEEFKEALKKVADTTKEAGEALEDISFSKQIKEAKGWGVAFENSVGGVLNSFKVLDNFGFKGLFGNLAAMQTQIKRLKDETKNAGKERMKQDLFGRKRGEENRAIKSGFSDLTSFDKSKKVAGFAKLQGAYRGMNEGDRSVMIRQLSGKTGATGVLDRFLMKKAMASGGGGLMGKVGMGLMSEGGGSILGGAMGAAAGPIAAIYGILQIASKGFERNKDIYSKLGGGGIVQSGNMGQTYDNWSHALSAGGAGQGASSARYFDLDFEKMTDLMKEVIESGQAVQNKYGMINGGMSPDQALTGGRATNVYSGIVRNAAMFGKNVGLDSGQSAKLTMKLMHDFSLSMGEVEDMFIHVDKAVQVTGISTVAYIKLIDDVTSQFDKLNKSLSFTCGLMLILGKNAKYTDDDIKGMVQGLTGEKKPYEQSVYAYGLLSDKERKGVALSRQSQYQREGVEVENTFHLNKGDSENLTKEQLQHMVDAGHPEQQALMTRFVNDRDRGRSAMKDPSAFGLATQDETFGQDLRSRMTTQASLLQSIMPKGTHLSDFMGGTKGAEKRIDALQSDPRYSLMAQHFNLTPGGLSAKYGAAGQQIMSSVTSAATMGGKEGEAARAKFPSTTPTGWKEIREALAAGKSVSQTKAGQGILANIGASDFAEIITKAEEKAAEEKAKENQSYITSPLDRIEKLLKSVVDNLVTILQKIVNFFNFQFLGKNTYQTVQANKRAAADYIQNQLPGDQEKLNKLKAYEGSLTKKGDYSKAAWFKSQNESAQSIMDLMKSGHMTPEALNIAHERIAKSYLDSADNPESISTLIRNPLSWAVLPDAQENAAKGEADAKGMEDTKLTHVTTDAASSAANPQSGDISDELLAAQRKQENGAPHMHKGVG